MIEVRPFAAIGHADHGWLNARHHFSFASYHDQNRMGWGNIRVWNDDEIAAHKGFAEHPHNDMEIITYVRRGAISHRDSLGNEGRTPAGDVQVMSAGSGIRHSEFNREDETTTLFQIWILPDQMGVMPDWGQRAFPKGERAGQWVVLASDAPDADGSLSIRADARVLGATLKKGESLTYDADPQRHIYLVPATGAITINDHSAKARDGIAITGEAKLLITAVEESELVLVDAR